MLLLALLREYVNCKYLSIEVFCFPLISEEDLYDYEYLRFVTGPETVRPD